MSSDPADQHEVAVAVEPAEVAAAQPPVGPVSAAAVLIGVTPVAAHGAGRADVHAADRRRRRPPPVVVAELDLDAGLRATDRAVLHLGRVVGLGAGDRRATRSSRSGRRPGTRALDAMRSTSSGGAGAVALRQRRRTEVGGRRAPGGSTSLAHWVGTAAGRR